jgi:rSAM/selenodomain-associated transferase 2
MRSSVNVSVIIPVLNEAERIESAIDRAWQAGADEVIVVDGGSEDDTTQRAGNSRCRVITSARGRALQQNAGAKIATGDVLLFLHADTWLAPGAIDQVRSAMQRPSVVGGAFRQIIGARGAAYRVIERGNALRVRLFGRAYGDQGIFVRREAFEQLGGFPDVPFLEDLLFMRRVNRLRAPNKRGQAPSSQVESRGKADAQLGASPLLLETIRRPVLLPGPIHVSARRWQRRGVVRQTLRNWAILVAHWFGATPKSLARWYFFLAAYWTAA